jgi:hypothetical protein
VNARRSLPLSTLGIAFACLATAGTARAAGPLGDNGTQLSTSSYAVDMYTGVVNAGVRPTSLGGAYVALAEDTDGNTQNPATPALRAFFSQDHFDYWLGFGVTVPAGVKDYFNTQGKLPAKASEGTAEGCASTDNILYITPATNLQFGPLGIGVSLEILTYGASFSDLAAGQPRSARLVAPVTHLQVAYALDHNQLILGAGARLAAFNVDVATGGSLRGANAFHSFGSGLEVGAIWKPERWPLRVGAAFRTAIDTQPSYSNDLLPDANGDLTLETTRGTAYLPLGVSLPWDLNVGAAVQLGGRPLNVPWRDIEERIERQKLEHALRRLDRERDKQKALAAATNEAERDVALARWKAAQEEDDRQLEETRQDARWDVKNQEARMKRFYLMATGAVVVTGAVPNAIGIESLLQQTVNRSGANVVLSPRFGLESEVWPDILKLRGGMYVEPTRVETSLPRLHVTAGLDLRAVRWDVFGLWPADYLWRLGVGVDFADRYSSVGFTFGGWYPRHSGKAVRPD